MKRYLDDSLNLACSKCVESPLAIKVGPVHTGMSFLPSSPHACAFCIRERVVITTFEPLKLFIRVGNLANESSGE